MSRGRDATFFFLNQTRTSSRQKPVFASFTASSLWRGRAVYLGQILPITPKNARIALNLGIAHSQAYAQLSGSLASSLPRRRRLYIRTDQGGRFLMRILTRKNRRVLVCGMKANFRTFLCALAALVVISGCDSAKRCLCRRNCSEHGEPRIQDMRDYSSKSITRVSRFQR